MAKSSVSGFDEINKELEKLAKNADKLSKKKSVSFEELFTDAFIKRRTKCSSLSDFISESGFDWSSQKAFEAIPDDQLDDFVRSVSKFKSFQEMMDEAGEEYVKKQMGF